MISSRYAYPDHRRRPPPLLICNELVTDGHTTEDPASWHTCLHNSSLILTSARRQGWLIAHVYRHDRPPNPVADLRPEPDEPVFQCRGPSALSSPALRDLLAMNNVEELILVGRSLVPYCLATAIAAADLGVSVTMVTDAVSHPRIEANDADLSTTHAAIRLFPEFATMTTTAKLLQLQSSLSLFVSGS